MPDTLQVYWPGKFQDQPVTINASAFDPAKHRRLEDGPAEPTPTPAVEAPGRPKGKR